MAKPCTCLSVQIECEPITMESTHTRPYRFVIGGLSVWGHLLTGAGFQVVSPLLPLITDDYGIDHGTAGLIVAAPLLIIAIFGMPGGVLLGRIGLYRAYTIGWLLMGSSALAALSPGFEGLLALRIAFGLGVALMFPATGPLLMKWFRPKELTIVTSLNVGCMSLGMVIAMAAAAPLAEAMDWEMVIGIFGGVGLAGAIAWIILGKTKEDAAVGTPSGVTRGDIWAVLRNRTVLLLGFGDMACFMMYLALIGWLPTFYNESRDMSLTQAGFVTSIPPLMGVFGVLLGGYLPIKMQSKRMLFIIPGAMAALGGLGSFTLENTFLIYMSVIILGMGAWLYIPTMLTMPMELPGMTPIRIAIVWGFFMTAPGFGGFISPLAVGYLRDSFDTFVPGFLIFFALSWFLVISGFLLPKTSTKPSLPPDSPVPAISAPD